MSNDQIIPFQYESNEVRVIKDDEGNPWWVANDVCDVLGFKNPRQAIATHIEEDEKGVQKMDTMGGIQEMVIISESGLYALIVRSNKPEAKKFRKWVTSEVLPSIRKTGSYHARNQYCSKEELQAMEAMARKYKTASHIFISEIKTNIEGGMSLYEARLAAAKTAMECTGIDHSAKVIAAEAARIAKMPQADTPDAGRLLQELMSLEIKGIPGESIGTLLANPNITHPQTQALHRLGFRTTQKGIFILPLLAATLLKDTHPGMTPALLMATLIQLPGAIRTNQRIGGEARYGIEFYPARPAVTGERQVQ